MLSLTSKTRVLAALGVTDMRKSYDTLAERVRRVIGEDPLSGDVFVFCNKARNRIKLLCFDRGGYWLIARRLERGTFAWPRERGFDVRFTTVQELAARLRGAHADHSVEEVIQEYIEPELVILDELGFTPLDRLLADAFYRIIASRYERSSLIVTSNKSFESWGEVFPDPVIASAILDRLVHHAHLVPIVGDSFRMQELKQRKQGGPQPKN